MLVVGVLLGMTGLSLCLRKVFFLALSYFLQQYRLISFICIRQSSANPRRLQMKAIEKIEKKFNITNAQERRTEAAQRKMEAEREERKGREGFGRHDLGRSQLV